MECPNKNFIKKYGVKCIKKNKKIKCKNLEKLKQMCSPCNYFHIIKCHKKYYALPCMYPCGNYGTGLFNMCPHMKEDNDSKCYDILKTIKF